MDAFPPPIAHVATDRSGSQVSVPWYEALFDATPVLDEDTNPDFHHTVYSSATARSSVCTTHDARAQRAVQRVPDPASITSIRVRGRGTSSLAFGGESWAKPGIEHGAIKDAPYGSGVASRSGRHRLEFLVPPG